jgi:hypothetical protein
LHTFQDFREVVNVGLILRPVGERFHRDQGWDRCEADGIRLSGKFLLQSFFPFGVKVEWIIYGNYSGVVLDPSLN